MNEEEKKNLIQIFLQKSIYQSNLISKNLLVKCFYDINIL